MKKITLQVLGILIGITFALLMIELVLRIFGENSAAWTGPDDILGYSFIPNAYYKFQPPEGCPGWGADGYINSKGLKDFEYDYAKPANTFRILAIGDSFTEAMQHPMEIGWTKQLEKLLNEQSDNRNYEVINAGVGGYGTAQEYLFYKNVGYRYSPDLVILMFYSNDVLDNSRELNFQQSIPFYTTNNNELFLDNSFLQSKAYRLKKILDPIKPKSYFVSFLARLYNQISKTQNQANIDARATQIPAETQASGWERAETEKALEVTRRLFEELNKSVLNNGSKMVILNIDENVTVITDGPDKMFSDLSSSQGILYFDLFPTLEKHFQSAGEYMFGCVENEGGGHLSPAGNTQTARLIFEYLVSQKLIAVSQ